MRFAHMRICAFAALVLLGLTVRAPIAGAIEIQRVISPGGIEAWLVEEHAIPIIALTFAVPRGSWHDPAGKEGLAHLLSATLDEGAGDLDSQAFRARIDDHAITLSFDTDLDQFTGDLQMLSEFRDEAFDLLALSMTQPRFDPEPVETIKSQIMANIAREQVDAGKIASKSWFVTAYGDSGYGRPKAGTLESVKALGPEDLRAFYSDILALDGMKIGVVGDISAEELGPLLDQTFGGLSRSSSLAPIPDSAPAAGANVVTVEMDVPQTEMRFGMKGIERSDPEFVPGYVMNYILGGGGFSSRLYDEVREKRGLTYSVYSYLFPLKGSGIWFGGAATRADRAQTTLAVIKDQIALMSEEGPSADELDAAKRYLTGAYPLRFDSNSKIANQLVGIQIEDLGIDYIDRRNELIHSVTIEDVRRVARTLLKPDQMIVVLVGSRDSIAEFDSGG